MVLAGTKIDVFLFNIYIGIYLTDYLTDYLSDYIYLTDWLSIYLYIYLVLLCTIPTIQFCTQAFSSYSRYSDSFYLFEIQIKNIFYFGEFYQNNIFLYIICGVSLITLIYLLRKPKDIAPSTATFMQMLDRRGASGYSNILTTNDENAQL